MPTLPAASSVVDFLKNKGFQPVAGESLPLYNTRKQIYEQSGLGSSLGDYQGTAGQNNSLMQFLSGAESKAGAAITPQNLQSIISIARGSGASAGTNTVDYGGFVNKAGTIYEGSRGYQTPEELASRLGIPVTQINWSAIQQNDNYNPMPATDAAGALATGGNTAAGTVASAESTSVSQDVLNSIYNPLEGRDIGAEALDRVQSSATFPLQQADVEAKKAAVQLKAQTDTTDFINKIASRGLYFSGKKGEGVSAIESNKLADLLGIDRDYAMLLAKGIESSAQQIVKEAQEGSQNAINALEKMGYVIDPVSGTIQPTLAAKNAAQSAYQFERTQARLEDTAAVTQELNQAKYELSVAKTQAQIEQATNNYNLAVARYELAVAKASGNGVQPGAVGATLAQATKKGFTQTRNSSGGLNLLISGKPATMEEWYRGSGVSIEEMLKNSTDSGDQDFLGAYKRGMKMVDNGEADTASVYFSLATDYPRYASLLGYQPATTLSTPASSETPGTVAPTSKIEQRIQEMKTGSQKALFQDNTMVRDALRNQGFSDAEIASSSAGLVLGKIGAATSSFFSRLFGQ